MSSKLYEGGLGANPSPISWGGGAERAAGHAPGPPSDASLPAEDGARLQEAYAKGVAAGEATGATRALERLAPAFAGLSSMLQQLAATPKRVRAEAEASTVELALAIARRILHREIAADPEAILGLVRHAAERVNARELHRLRVAPGDAAMLIEHRDRLNLPAALEIIADPQLTPGSALFETARGELDASVGTQLDEIQRGLTDLVRRRSR